MFVMERLQVDRLKEFLKWLKKKKGLELREEVHSSEGVYWLPPFEDIEELLNQFHKTTNITK
jgi:hypothetical protein